MKRTLFFFFPLLCLLSVEALLSCGSDHEDDEGIRAYQVSYTVTTGGVQGFTTEQANVHIEVMNLLQAAVNKANGGETVTLQDAKAHDSRVMAACYTTQDSVESYYTSFRGTLYVTNSATKKVIYTLKK